MPRFCLGGEHLTIVGWPSVDACSDGAFSRQCADALTQISQQPEIVTQDGDCRQTSCEFLRAIRVKLRSGVGARCSSKNATETDARIGCLGEK